MAIYILLKILSGVPAGPEIPSEDGSSCLDLAEEDPKSCWSDVTWACLLAELDFQIEHRAGAKHLNADGLSRRPVQANAIKRKPLFNKEEVMIPTDP